MNHIRRLELNVSFLRDELVIKLSPIRALEIDQIRPHAAHGLAFVVSDLSEPKLDHGVLLAAAWMIGCAVGDESFAPEEPAGAFVEVQGGQEGVAFEDEQAPLV